ncbi:hypothetical protein [Actibacterium sp. MT2.3-13A]|uniref:hypothetical protein n=1 Tax=Actibacterium sp. MT2.3-13A TaxID=2828332 RepID=UPI001BAB0E8B|nr:hypothetical protein [Actibacterium sp. MT2.3-13A]
MGPPAQPGDEALRRRTLALRPVWGTVGTGLGLGRPVAVALPLGGLAAGEREGEE